ncbi:HisA/HisF-related TIM barrel protein, partial [Methylibium sp.]|uniref:HisA/HisF-related TIM barrel protein n=1 Tax=Methylibium sp. TaxID=2067992 RepID=UPI00286C3312
MHVIPVIDLRHGLVVRAVRGERATYRPIESALAGSADPRVVARSLCGHCATDTLYLADLDALQGGAVQLGVIAALLQDRPALQLWLDAGFVDLAGLHSTLAALGRLAARVTPVLASESWCSLDELRAACRVRLDARPSNPAQPDASSAQPLLSLDRRNGVPLDLAGLWRAPQHWPERVIVMSLERVGSDGGPDLETLAAVRATAPRATLIGAGGVRHAGDLRAAAEAGASAWLVASALHDGRLDGAALRSLATVAGVPGAASIATAPAALLRRLDAAPAATPGLAQGPAAPTRSAAAPAVAQGHGIDVPNRAAALRDTAAMTSTQAVNAVPWTCPFCPLLCDGFALERRDAGYALSGSDCPRAATALARFTSAPAPTSCLIDGQPATLDAALDAAARVLAASRQPLFGGLGTDISGARALYPLACATGAISDVAAGDALFHGLRALQDRGAFTTTLAEVRNRADLIVCIGGSPREAQPEIWRRLGLGEPLVAARHVAFVGAPLDAALAALPGVTQASVALAGDLFDTTSLLAALVAGRRVAAPADLVALAGQLRQARYAVIVWEAPRLPAHGALIVEALDRIVAQLNRHTRAATLPLAGADGAASVNQVFAWLSGLPLRSRAGPLGL